MVVDTPVPVQVSAEAARFMEELGIQEPFQRMLDEIPKRFQAVYSIAVTLVEPVDEGGGDRIVFNVTREQPGEGSDPSRHQWRRWVIDHFPPEIFEHFVLLINYVESHAR